MSMVTTGAKHGKRRPSMAALAVAMLTLQSPYLSYQFAIALALQ